MWAIRKDFWVWDKILQRYENFISFPLVLDLENSLMVNLDEGREDYENSLLLLQPLLNLFKNLQPIAIKETLMKFGMSTIK